MSSRSNKYVIDEERIVPISHFNRYKVGDHVATYYYYYKGLILCGIIQRISISDQKVQFLVDRSSEIRIYNFCDLFGRIERYYNNNLINFVCV